MQEIVFVFMILMLGSIATTGLETLVHGRKAPSGFSWGLLVATVVIVLIDIAWYMLPRVISVAP